jgi:ABC-type multidrug transport system fused ATPase/permease subunit
MCFGIAIGLLSKKLVNKSYAYGNQISKAMYDLEHSSNEFVSGIKTIKATASERYVASRYEAIISNLANITFKSNAIPTYVKNILESSSIAILCLILFYVIRKSSGDISVVMLISAAFVRLIPKLYGLQQNMQLLGVYLPAVAKLHYESAVLTKRSEVNTLLLSAPLGTECFDISLSDVSVSYGTTTILKGVSLEIPAGHTIGIVGASGSGKTTLIDSLIGLHAISSGSIKINGVPIEKLPIHDFRQHVGYVSQDTFLFHDTIRANISWGASFDPENVRIAAEQANADSFIVKLPRKYDTIVGSKGTRLSGGERQRIGLARALVSSPGLLILDEATSSLDSTSEEVVVDAINSLHGKMTIIVVAHRLSVVRNCDTIYVMKAGAIAESGTWDQLVSNKSDFYEYYTSQQLQ